MTLKEAPFKRDQPLAGELFGHTSVSDLMRMFFTALLLLLSFSPIIANAGETDVVKVRAKQASDGTWSFHVTLRHTDKGWDHYANRWEILTEGRKVLATRVLAHPHTHEQPFTRSLSGVKLPKGTKAVIVRGHDSVDKYGGKEILYPLDTSVVR